jgi:hypothetical protein
MSTVDYLRIVLYRLSVRSLRNVSQSAYLFPLCVELQ